MAGLFYKELLYVRCQGKILFLLAALYLFIFLQANTVYSLVSLTFMVCILISSILALTSFSNDDQCRWNVYALSMPENRGGIIFSKYLFFFLTAILCIAFSAVFFSVKQLWCTQALLGLYLDFSAAVLFQCVMFPLLFLFGTQRFRLLMAFLFVIPSILFLLFKDRPLPPLASSPLQALLYLSPFLLCAVTAGSVFLSFTILKRKKGL